MSFPVLSTILFAPIVGAAAITFLPTTAGSTIKKSVRLPWGSRSCCH